MVSWDGQQQRRREIWAVASTVGEWAASCARWTRVSNDDDDDDDVVSEKA